MNPRFVDDAKMMIEYLGELEALFRGIQNMFEPEIEFRDLDYSSIAHRISAVTNDLDELLYPEIKLNEVTLFGEGSTSLEAATARHLHWTPWHLYIASRTLHEMMYCLSEVKYTDMPEHPMTAAAVMMDVSRINTEIAEQNNRIYTWFTNPIHSKVIDTNPKIRAAAAEYTKTLLENLLCKAIWRNLYLPLSSALTELYHRDDYSSLSRTRDRNRDFLLWFVGSYLTYMQRIGAVPVKDPENKHKVRRTVRRERLARAIGMPLDRFDEWFRWNSDMDRFIINGVKVIYYDPLTKKNDVIAV